MKATYETAISQVFKDEGGYSNDAGDPGGPTNWGITIIDARRYWKADATAEDVRAMPRSIAEQIYIEHYATPLDYDALPAGVDYAVLDFGINSGISRSAKYLQSIVGAKADGVIGPATLNALSIYDQSTIINRLYDERLAFLEKLSTWSIFGRGWRTRCNTGRALALKLAASLPSVKRSTTMTTTTTTTTAAGGLATMMTELDKITKVLETVVGYVPMVAPFFPPLAPIVPFLPVIQGVLALLDQIEASGGDPVAIFKVLESAVPDVIAKFKAAQAHPMVVASVNAAATGAGPGPGG